MFFGLANALANRLIIGGRLGANRFDRCHGGLGLLELGAKVGIVQTDRNKNLERRPGHVRSRVQARRDLDGLKSLVEQLGGDPPQRLIFNFVAD